MTLLALTAVICFGFAVYNLTCAFADIPTKRTSRMMLLARKQQGVKAEKLLDVYLTKIAGLIAPYLKLDKLKRNKLQRALDIAGMELTPEVYTARAWVTAGAVGLSSLLMAFLIPLIPRSLRCPATPICGRFQAPTQKGGISAPTTKFGFSGQRLALVRESPPAVLPKPKYGAV